MSSKVERYKPEELKKVLHYLDGPLRLALKENVEVVKSAGIKLGDKVLDIGCGSGFLSLEAAQVVGDNGKVYSLDMREEMLEVLVEKAKKSNLVDRISTICSSATKLPFDDESFDAVIMSYVLHENVESVEGILHEVMRVLKKGGKFAASDFIRVDDEERNKEIEEWHKSTDPESEEDEVHFVFTKDDFRTILQKSGLENISADIWYEFHVILAGEKR